MKLLRFVLKGFLFIIIVLIIVAMIALLIQGWNVLINVLTGAIGFILPQILTSMSPVLISIVAIIILIIAGNFFYNFIEKMIRKVIPKKLYNNRGKVVAFKPAAAGAWEIGIVTNEFEDYVVIFSPTFPSIFTGPLRIIKKGEVIQLNILPQDLVNFILTAGAINPIKKLDKIKKSQTGGK